MLEVVEELLKVVQKLVDLVVEELEIFLQV
jgi:hypothetical protein